MTDSLLHQPMGSQSRRKAREILDGLSGHRIDPSTLEMTDSESCARGGQGTIIAGTRILPAFLKTYLERRLAIKKFEWNREDAEASDKFFNSFAYELSIMASLSHPNTVAFLGFVEDMEKGDAWIVLPWEPNGNVREFLASGEWDIPERVSLIEDVANGVEYLHTRQPPICHGDLKSMNILVSSSHNAVITDFGSARTKGNLDPKTEDGDSEPPRRETIDDIVQELISPKIKFNRSTLELTLTGPGYSLRWTAPEVLESEVQDLPSDMWALGWICWEIFTGKIPFDDLHAMGPVVSNVVKGKLPAIREEASLSHILELCCLMTGCWMSNPVERIDASTFRRKVHFMPSVKPSANRSGGAKVRSAALLCELGDMYRHQSNTVDAESHYQTAIEVATRTKDNKVKAEALDGLGELYVTQSRYQEAREAFREAHKIHCRIGNELGAANALAGLGETYHAQSRNQEAEKAWKEAHEIYSRIGNDVGAANALDGLGEVYRVQSRNREAEKAFMDAYEIHSCTGTNMGAANALFGLGNVYRAQSRYREAEKAFMDAHEIQSRIGDNLGVANTLHCLGVTYHTQSKYREAEKAFMDAHQIHSRIGNDQGTANELLGLGNIYGAQSRYREAEKAFMDVHEINSRIGHDLGVANALLGLGNTYHSQLKYREAEKAFIDAHESHSRIGNDLGAASAVHGLGAIYRAQSRDQEAEKAFMDAHEIHSRIGDDQGVASALHALGKTYHAQSRYREAEKAIMDAHEINSRIGHDLGVANALDALGNTYGAQSRYREAERAFMGAHEIHSRIGNDLGTANALLGLGNTYQAQSRDAEAENVLRDAYKIYSHIGDSLGAGSAFAMLVALPSKRDGLLREVTEVFRLGVLYSRQHRRDEAEKYFAEARNGYALFADKEGEAKALNGLVGVYALQRKFAAARAACVEARQIYAQMDQSMSVVCAAVGALLQAWEQ